MKTQANNTRFFFSLMLKNDKLSANSIIVTVQFRTIW